MPTICQPPPPVSPLAQSEGRGVRKSVRSEGPKPERLKEFLKATLILNQTGAIHWEQEVQNYFLAKSQESKEGKEKMQWCLPGGAGEPAPKNLLLQKAQELAKALQDGGEVANKFKRLLARVNVCRDKEDLLVAVARFFPTLKPGTQKALNACDEQWQAWDLHSLQQLFLLAKIFLEANLAQPRGEKDDK